MPTFRERVDAFFNPAPAPAPGRKRPAREFKPSLGGQRARLSEPAGGAADDLGLSISGSTVDQDQRWRALNLDDRTLDRMSSSDLMKMMINISPDISAGLWHFVRFCNPGWDLMVKMPGADEDQHEQGQAALVEFLELLGEYYGAVDVVFNALFISGFMTGGICSELVINNAGNAPIDMVAVDGNAVQFKKVNDPERGTIWQLGQKQDGEWVSLDVPTIGYVGVDPAPGKRKGRPIATAALFSSIFLLSLLHDLRRVISQQGYPRIDLSIDLQATRDAMPDDIADDPDAFKKWIDDTIDEVAAVYATLKPDDAYVHADTVDVKGSVGTVDAKSLGAVDGMIRALERMIVKGLKTMPLLMGSNESTAESHANRQWEVYVAGIKAFQHLTEQLLARLFKEALRVLGMQADVEFKFAELRASEQLRDAQTEAIIIANERAKYEQGWTTQDEGSLAVTGHPADQETPRVIDLAGGTDLITADIAEGGLTDPAMAGQGNLDGEESDDQGEDRVIVINGNGTRLTSRIVYGQPDRNGIIINRGAFDKWLESNGGNGSAVGEMQEDGTIRIGQVLQEIGGDEWAPGDQVFSIGYREPSEAAEALAEFRDAREGLEAIITAMTK